MSYGQQPYAAYETWPELWVRIVAVTMRNSLP